ncbi:hypothetical protein VSS37_00825, partial [Candidatus Thiothrix sp. Deng01]|nr:hypothetical protein [Candidatus Thiothrix sp. Deng01]
GANSPETIRAAVFDSFAAMPNPAPLGDAVLNRIADKLAINWAHTRPAAVHGQQDSQTAGQQNTVHGQQDSARQPVTTVHGQQDSQTAGQQNTVHGQSGQPELTAAAKALEADLYPEWLSQVSIKAITQGARDAKRFISQSTFTHGDKTVLSVQEMERIWNVWQERAANDGVLKANPKYQPGNRQPKYLLTA